jgi:hypothetical protein
MKRIAVVRESGGYGDILCSGGAIQAYKRENPDDVINFFVPEEFVKVAEHLGPHHVTSIGSLAGGLGKYRRWRDTPIDPVRHPYLKPVMEFNPDKVLDLYCPGFLYETSCRGECLLSRAELFALALGVRDTGTSCPQWHADTIEAEYFEREAAQAKLKQLGVEPGFIGVALRGTCPCRVYDSSYAQAVVQALACQRPVVVFDCVRPHFMLPTNTTAFIGRDWVEFAGVLSLAGLLVCVDSGPMHCAAAVNTPSLCLFGNTSPSAINNYPKAHAIKGHDDRCVIPCNYNPSKHWDKGACRARGCPRMKSIKPAQIIEQATRILNQETV